MTLNFLPYDNDEVACLRSGGLDAYGNPAERSISDGQGKPCRSCLCNIGDGREMLICAARPFAASHAYAETGPVFFCADECTPHGGAGIPAVLQTSPDYLLKGYDEHERIVYGTGQITPKGQVAGYAATLLERAEIAYVDVRSARNNCFLTRIVSPA